MKLLGFLVRYALGVPFCFLAALMAPIMSIVSICIYETLGDFKEVPWLGDAMDEWFSFWDPHGHDA